MREDAGEFGDWTLVPHRHYGIDLQAGGGQHIQGEIDCVGAGLGRGILKGESVRPRKLRRGHMREGDHRGPFGAEARVALDRREPVAAQAPPLGRVGNGFDDSLGREHRELRRQQRHAQQRAAPSVWISVEGRVNTRASEGVELVMHDVRLRVKVRDMDACAGRRSDARDLLDARGRVGLVSAAHMRDIDAAGTGDRRAQCRNLAGGGEDAGNVVEAG